MVMVLFLACAHTADSPAAKDTVATDSDSGGDSDSAAPYVGCSEEPFVAFDVGSDAICGVRADGCIDCAAVAAEPSWNHHLDEPPAGVFTHVTMSDGCVDAFNDGLCSPEYGACATGDSGAVSCWGWPFDEDAVDDDDVWTDPPTGDVAQLVLGYDNATGLTSDGSVRCWGAWGATECDAAAGYSFVQLVSGDGYSCGLTADGVAVCWGFSQTAWSGEISDAELAQRQLFLDAWGADGPYDRLVATPGEVCGLRRDGTTNCFPYYGDWLGKPRPETTLPTTDLAVAGSVSDSTDVDGICVLDTDGRVVCDASTPDFWVDVSLLDGNSYVALATEVNRVCGLTDDGRIICALVSSTEAICPFCTELWD